MAEKHVFISFDFENDQKYKELLNALSANANSDISFDDRTPGEIQTNSVDRVKAVLTKRITDSTHTLVIVGAHANSNHPDRAQIGTRNWQWWEIEKSAELGKKLVAVKINSSNDSPEPLKGKGASWARTYKIDSILNAINSA